MKIDKSTNESKETETHDSENTEKQGVKAPTKDRSRLYAYCALGGIAVVIIGAIIYSTSYKPKHTEVKPQSSVTKPKESVAPSKEEVKEKPVTNEDKAKKALERSDAPVTEGDSKQGKASLTEALNYLKGLKENFNPVHYGKLNPTSQTIGIQIQTAFDLGYTPDVEHSSWYLSNHGNVQQFVFNMSKGDQSVSFAGNYLTSTQQLDIASMKGTLPASTSNNDGPQALVQ